jgi:hypothetical protein
MGTTDGILDSELQMKWEAQAQASRKRAGALATLTLEHRHNPAVRLLEVEVTRLDTDERGCVTISARETASGENVRCVLHSKLADAMAIGIGRRLRLTGFRMLRLPSYAKATVEPALLDDEAAYRADGRGDITVLPTPHTTVVLGTEDAVLLASCQRRLASAIEVRQTMLSLCVCVSFFPRLGLRQGKAN